MGLTSSSAPPRSTAVTATRAPPRSAPSAPTFRAIPNLYKTLEQVQQALRASGLESSNLIISIDYTKSNTWNGKNTYAGNSLHHIEPTTYNPYQRVMDVMARTLEPFDDDKLIPVYGFGDVTTTDKAVFPLYPDEHPCYGVDEVLRRYTEITPMVQLSGPTSFAPVIKKAIEIVERTKQYHILIIIADGQVTDEASTKDAIVQASNYPLSIVMIGVGDGPWDMMEEFDDGLPKRKFDNFQFVNYYEVMTRANIENYDVEFAVAALQEIPEQFKMIRQLGLFRA
ncbi:E3 ubiquitin-protein ligase RGLG2 [Pelomyxa schiedti]|nr:E3 ubiquitin-protein ligase RGLG2 [Pelomyxa schiedti]